MFPVVGQAVLAADLMLQQVSTTNAPGMHLPTLPQISQQDVEVKATEEAKRWTVVVDVATQQNPRAQPSEETCQRPVGRAYNRFRGFKQDSTSLTSRVELRSGIGVDLADWRPFIDKINVSDFLFWSSRLLRTQPASSQKGTMRVLQVSNMTGYTDSMY